jgi:DNA-binding response OmpR family regulator
MSEPYIAIVDDDKAHLTIVQRALAGKARVKVFTDAESMLADIELPQMHLIILDWELPGMSGLDALKVLRSSRTTPVLFLTSFDAENRVITALSSGADDYLVKPFRSGEFSARIQALLRRFQIQQFQIHKDPLLERHGVVIHSVDSSIVMPNQDKVQLSGKEFALAVLLLENIGQPLSREQIVHAVWGRGEDVPSRTLDTHLSRLRTKLNWRPEMGWRLVPVYSFGYRLEVVVEAEPV